MRSFLRLAIIIACFVSVDAKASNYYWVGGSGNWSDLSHWATTSGGTTFQTQIPTALDDVFFDANSFTAPGQTVTLDPLTILAHDITWTGVTNTPTVTGSASALLKIFGTLRFVSGMNMNFAGDVSFDGTTTGKTITMAGKSFQKAVSFNGIGGGWTLTDVFNTTGIISLNSGSLATNNQTVNAGGFSSGSTSSRTLNLGSSILNFSGGNAWSVSSVSSGLTISSGTSVINANAADASFSGGGGHTYNDINFTNTVTGGSGTISQGNNTYRDITFSAAGNLFQNNIYRNVSFARQGQIGNGTATNNSNTFNNLSFVAGYTYLIWSGSVQTVNGTLNVNGTCGAFVDMHTDNPGSFTTINHPAGAVNISYTILQDIHAGGGGTFTANNSIDLGNNTGWTINSPTVKNLYWIGNAGNWDDGNHWALSSGGAPSGCSPTPSDNVFFDGNSFSIPGQSVNINVPTVYCRDMTWTGVTNNPDLTGASTNLLKIYGSLNFATAMNISFLGKTYFESPAAGKTITMNSQIFKNDVQFNGVGTWTLQDAFATIQQIQLNRGTLTTNNKTVTANEFYSNSPATSLRTLNMGSSVFNLSGGSAWLALAPGFTLNSGTSVINCTGVGPGFSGAGLVYYDLNFTNTNADGQVSGNNTIHDGVFSSSVRVLESNIFHNATFLGKGEIGADNSYTNLTFTAPYTYTLGANKTQTVSGLFTASGNCNALLTIISKTPGLSASISHPAGAINLSFLVLKDITATGGGTFNAANSVNLGNNIGWNFTSPTGKDLYWVGNTGNWNDGSHWALTSGGTPFGCSPTPLDNVFFDVNSFSSGGRTVTITAPTAYCRNMSWAGATNTPTFAGSPDPVLKIYGSLIFASAMNQNFLGDVDFEATVPGQTILTATRSFKKNVNFRGSNGGWILQDAFTTAGTINLNYGSLTTNDKAVNAGAFFSLPLPGLLTATRTLNMGSSVFDLSGANGIWNVSPKIDGLTINSGTSVVNALSLNGAQFNGGGGHIYYDVNFTGNGSTTAGYIQQANNTYHDVLFSGRGFINNANIFHDVTFSRDGDIQDNCDFHDLLFTSGYTYTLGSGKTQTISNKWKIQGSCTEYIVLRSSTQGTQTNVIKTSGSVLGYNIHLKDIKCSGGAVFTAYNSVDLGGNSGWSFSSLPPLQNPNPVVGPATVCPGATNVVYHIPPVPGAIGYQWTVPAGATIVSGQGDTLIVVNFGTAVSGNISVQSFNGCNYGLLSSSLTLVAGATTAPTLSITVSPTGAICPGVPVTFTATATPIVGSGATYNFTVNGNSVQNGASNIFTTTTLDNGDQVKCILTTATSACAGAFVVPSNTISMVVYPKPVIIFSPINTTITADGSIQLNATVNVAVLSYLWTPADGLSSTTIPNPIADPVKTTTYTLTVTSTDHCIGTKDLTVNVIPNCTVSIPNAFSPNGDGINDKWVIARGTCINKFRVAIYNRYGSLVYRSEDYQSNWDGTYKGKSLPDGTYYYVATAVNRGVADAVYRGDITILR